jgi:hypothetical protein
VIDGHDSYTSTLNSIRLWRKNPGTSVNILWVIVAVLQNIQRQHIIMHAANVGDSFRVPADGWYPSAQIFVFNNFFPIGSYLKVRHKWPQILNDLGNSVSFYSTHMKTEYIVKFWWLFTEFWLVIGFIGNLWLGNIFNYYALTNSPTLYFITIHPKSESVISSPAVAWQAILTMSTCV